MSSNSDIFEVEFKDGTKRIFSIDTTDHGGRKDLSHKLEIPFGRKGFSKEVKAGKKITIINLFMPLLMDVHGCLTIDEDNIIFLILNPLQMYSSVPFKNLTSGKGKVSPSSRWISNKIIIDVYNKKNFAYHKPKNARKAITDYQYAYVVHSKKFNEKTFKIFEMKELDEQVKEWKEYSKHLSKIQLKYLVENWEASAMNKFRQDLIGENGLSCSIENCVEDVPSNQLVASHSKSRASIRSDETLDIGQKIDQVKDKNNGLLCAQHDKLYDKGYITIDDKGNIIFQNNVAIQYKKFGVKIKQSLLNEKRLEYFEYHNKNIFIK